MSLLSKTSLENLINIQDMISERVKNLSCLEEAAQEYMNILFENFSESIVLSRFFATLPVKILPEFNKNYVYNLAKNANISDLINEKTLILSLFGTRGKETNWNDRFKSSGHVGIPLASSDFIDKIPMMSRLLKELGTGLDWINSNDTHIVAKTFKNLSGVFFVSDAKEEVDTLGRKIISAQDFVNKYHVETVFGIGGCYLGSDVFFTTIIFLREKIKRELAERFMLQANKFKTATLKFINSNRLYAESN